MLDAQNPTVELHGAVYWAENHELNLAEQTAAWAGVRPAYAAHAATVRS
jgi:hypothetical protein